MKKQTKPNPILGKRVRELRKAADLTQEKLADKLHFTAKYIGDLENGRRNITEQTADLLANLFHVDAEYFLDEGHEFKTSMEYTGEIFRQTDLEMYHFENAIASLAILNGYIVETPPRDIFSFRERVLDHSKDYMSFKQYGDEKYSLSMLNVQHLGHFLTDILMSYLKWHNEFLRPFPNGESMEESFQNTPVKE